MRRPRACKALTSGMRLALMLGRKGEAADNEAR